MYEIKSLLLYLVCFFSHLAPLYSFGALDTKDTITIAILAKDKAHTLPFYLTCLESQTWPTEQTYLYIRTNNNNDNTAEILRQWVTRVRGRYLEIYFDDTDVSQKVQRFGQHEWNRQRFKVLARIRQDSIDWAQKRKSHYFVADCDNFIVPSTIEELFKTGLPIVAPLLKSSTDYSNFHAAIDRDGYYKECSRYFDLIDQEVQEIVQVPVVHCTYFINYNFLSKIGYSDKTDRHEYVIFSHIARKKRIPQYLDARKIYGRITFAETTQELAQEDWINKF